MKEYIGIFDSGIGGLTTVRQLIRQLPLENVVFLADNKNMPYGSKTVEQIRVFTMNSMRFLNRFNLKALIVACNTSESNAIDIITENMNVPVYGVIRPTVKKTLEMTRNGKIGLLATPLTVKSHRYEDIIHEYDPEIKIYSKECPLLTPLIEEGKFSIDDTEMINAVKEYMKDIIDKDIDTLILGCTHYDVLIDLINRYYPDIAVVSSSRCVIDEIENDLKLQETNNDITRRYFTTSLDERFERVSKMIIEEAEFENVNV